MGAISRWNLVLLGVGGGVLLSSLVGGAYILGTRSAPTVERTTAAPSLKPSPSDSPSPNTSPTPSPAASPVAPPVKPAAPAKLPPPPRPNGTVTYDQSGKYGQGFSSGNCANWHIGWINNSSAEVVQITFAPISGEYSNGKYDSTRQEWPADKPAAAVLNVSIPPHATQEIRFKTCTSTPPPEGATEFSATPPTEFSWKWVTGHTGTNCYHFGC